MTSLTHHVIAAVASYYAMYVYWDDVYSTLGRNDRFPESARACSYYSVSAPCNSNFTRLAVQIWLYSAFKSVLDAFYCISGRSGH